MFADFLARRLVLGMVGACRRPDLSRCTDQVRRHDEDGVPGVRGRFKGVAAHSVFVRSSTEQVATVALQERAAGINGYVGKARAQRMSGGLEFGDWRRQGGITELAQDVVAVAKPLARDRQGGPFGVAFDGQVLVVAVVR
jgi:hypothetical protein